MSNAIVLLAALFVLWLIPSPYDRRRKGEAVPATGGAEVC